MWLVHVKGLRHPAPRWLPRGLSVGNCQEAVLTVTKTIHIEGGRAPYFTRPHPTLWFPKPCPPLSCSACQAPVTTWTVPGSLAPTWSCYRGGPPILVDIFFLWALGGLASFLHIRGLFQNIQGTSLSLNRMYPSLPFPHVP